MEGEGLLEPLIETGRRGLVHPRELLAQGLEVLDGLFVRGPLVGALQTLAPALLLRSRQLRDHVLPLVPLAPLDEHLSLEDRQDAVPETAGSIDHHERSSRQVETSLLQTPKEGSDHHGVLRVGLDEPEEDLVPLGRHPERDDHLVLGKALAVQDECHHVVT